MSFCACTSEKGKRKVEEDKNQVLSQNQESDLYYCPDVWVLKEEEEEEEEEKKRDKNVGRNTHRERAGPDKVIS
ncbi:hypothetical protein OUZ56_008903 [Daphnia magna]|uniref:Uncharacterized protein n=1 Tax=Daphnia magna TaxID=35525 RepID=A0ABR0AED7_9CRUS|nr:hypothetical protein OUZ56_008903 [Daphnia magna]